VTHDQIEAMTMADRIVVMHDGIVEQIGTPLDLFDRPGNLFVAQFIGSPSMNILAGTLRQGEGGTWVEAQGQRWPTVPQAQGQDGQAVQYGVRPGDMQLSTSGQGIPAKVVVVEPTGAETELLLRVGEADLVQLYKHAYALAFATFCGPDNIPPLEAFGLGCPVIASRVPGAEEQLGDAALLFAPEDERALAARILELRDPAVRLRLIEAGERRARQGSWEDYAAAIISSLDAFSRIRRAW